MKYSAEKTENVELPEEDREVYRVEIPEGREVNYRDTPGLIERLPVQEGPVFLEVVSVGGESRVYLSSNFEDTKRELRNAFIPGFEGADLKVAGDPFKEMMENNSVVAAGEAGLFKDRIYPISNMEENSEEFSRQASPYQNVVKGKQNTDVLIQVRIGGTDTDPASRRVRDRGIMAGLNFFFFLMGGVGDFLADIIAPENKKNKKKKQQETEEKKSRLETMKGEVDEEIATKMDERSGGESSFRVGVRAAAAAQTPQQADAAMRLLENEIEVASRDPVAEQYVDLNPAKRYFFLNDADGCAERIAQRKWIPKWKRFLTPTEPTFVIPRAEELAAFAHIPLEEEWRQGSFNPGF